MVEGEVNRAKVELNRRASRCRETGQRCLRALRCRGAVQRCNGETEGILLLPIATRQHLAEQVGGRHRGTLWNSRGVHVDELCDIGGTGVLGGTVHNVLAIKGGSERAVALIGDLDLHVINRVGVLDATDRSDFLADRVGVLAGGGVLDIAEQDLLGILGHLLDERAVLGAVRHGCAIDGRELGAEFVGAVPVAANQLLRSLETVLGGERNAIANAVGVYECGLARAVDGDDALDRFLIRRVAGCVILGDGVLRAHGQALDGNGLAVLQLEHVAVLAGGDDATVEALTAIAVVLVQRVARCVRQGDPERELLLLVNLGALVLGELDGLADLQGAGLGEVLRGRVGIDHGSMVAKLDVGGVRDAVGERGLVHPGLKGHGAGGVGLNVVDLPRQLVLVLVEGAAIARGAIDVGEALGQLVRDGHRRGILARVRIAHGVSEDVTDLDIALVGILDFLPGNEDLGLGSHLGLVLADLNVGLVLNLVVEGGLGHLDREDHGAGGIGLLLAETPGQGVGVGVVDAAVSRGTLIVGSAGRNLIGDGHVGGDSLTGLVDGVVHPVDGVDEPATDLDELAVDRCAGLALSGDVLALCGLLIRVGEGHDLARDLQNLVRRLAGVVLDLGQDGGRRERSAVRLDGDDKLVLGLGEGQVGIGGDTGLDDSILVRAGFGEADAAEAHDLFLGDRRGDVARALGHGCALGHSLELEGVGLVREPIASLEDLLDLQCTLVTARDYDSGRGIGVDELHLLGLALVDGTVHGVGDGGEALELPLHDLVLSTLGQALDGD